MPESIVKKSVCAKTGKLASSEFCSAYTEYFAEGTVPKQGCNGHAEEEAAKKAAEEAAETTGDGTTATPSTNGSNTNSSNNGNSGSSGSSGSSNQSN